MNPRPPFSAPPSLEDLEAIAEAAYAGIPRELTRHVDNVVIRGGVNRVVDGILALHEKIGDFGTLLYCGKDWADPALSRRSMELMAEKVMPAVNAAVGKRVAAE